MVPCRVVCPHGWRICGVCETHITSSSSSPSRPSLQGPHAAYRHHPCSLADTLGLRFAGLGLHDLALTHAALRHIGLLLLGLLNHRVRLLLLTACAAMRAAMRQPCCRRPCTKPSGRSAVMEAAGKRLRTSSKKSRAERVVEKRPLS